MGRTPTKNPMLGLASQVEQMESSRESEGSLKTLGSEVEGSSERACDELVVRERREAIKQQAALRYDYSNPDRSYHLSHYLEQSKWQPALACDLMQTLPLPPPLPP